MPQEDHERPTGELAWVGKAKSHYILMREVVVTTYHEDGRQKSQTVEWRPLPKMELPDA